MRSAGERYRHAANEIGFISIFLAPFSVKQHIFFRFDNNKRYFQLYKTLVDTNEELFAKKKEKFITETAAI